MKTKPYPIGIVLPFLAVTVGHHGEIKAVGFVKQIQLYLQIELIVELLEQAQIGMVEQTVASACGELFQKADIVIYGKTKLLHGRFLISVFTGSNTAWSFGGGEINDYFHYTLFAFLFQVLQGDICVFSVTLRKALKNSHFYAIMSSINSEFVEQTVGVTNGIRRLE